MAESKIIWKMVIGLWAWDLLKFMAQPQAIPGYETSVSEQRRDNSPSFAFQMPAIYPAPRLRWIPMCRLFCGSWSHGSSLKGQSKPGDVIHGYRFDLLPAATGNGRNRRAAGAAELRICLRVASTLQPAAEELLSPPARRRRTDPPGANRGDAQAVDHAMLRDNTPWAGVES